MHISPREIAITGFTDASKCYAEVKSMHIVLRSDFMKRKTIGIALVSYGCGMLTVIFIPWWGFIAAFIMVVIGIALLFATC